LLKAIAGIKWFRAVFVPRWKDNDNEGWGSIEYRIATAPQRRPNIINGLKVMQNKKDMGS